MKDKDRVKELFEAAEDIAKDLGIGVVGNAKDHRVLSEIALILAIFKFQKSVDEVFSE